MVASTMGRKQKSLPPPPEQDDERYMETVTAPRAMSRDVVVLERLECRLRRGDVDDILIMDLFGVCLWLLCGWISSRVAAENKGGGGG
jgi:hypothetical protein